MSYPVFWAATGELRYPGVQDPNTSFVVSGFSRDIRAVNASFVVYAYFCCLLVVCRNLSGHTSAGLLWA
jgi:hypothetical protein